MHKNILLIIGVIALLSIFLLCINTFYWADDYGFISNIQIRGVVGSCIYGYNTWDGRFLTLSAFVQHFSLKYLPVEIITFIWSISFLLAGALSSLFIIKNSNIKNIHSKDKILFMLLFCTVFWMGSYTYVAQTIYWATGGAYSFNLLIGAFWYYSYNNLLNSEIQKVKFFLLVLLSIIAGASTQNLSIPLIIISLVLICVDLLNGKHKNIGYMIGVSTALIFGLLYISLAPGNVLRLQETQYYSTNFNFITIVKNFILLLKKFCSLNVFLVALASIASISLWLIIKPNSKFNYEFKVIIPHDRYTLATFLSSSKWLLAALGSFVPFIVIPNLASPRTTIYFTWCLIIFIFEFILNFNEKNFTPTENLSSWTTNKIISTTTIAFIFVFCISITSKCLVEGRYLKELISEREDVLKKARGNTITVNRIDPKFVNFCYKFTDFPIEENSGNAFVRRDIERYFGIKRIVVE